MAIEVTRTYVGSIQNHQQVRDGLDSLGDSASKIWNIARWTADRIWDATGEIPDEGVLTIDVRLSSVHTSLQSCGFARGRIFRSLSRHHQPQDGVGIKFNYRPQLTPPTSQ